MSRRKGIKNKKKIIPIEGEEWRIIEGSNDRYQVSNMGRIKKDWYNDRQKRKEVKLLRGHINPSGDVKVILRIGHKYSVAGYVHNMVIKAFFDIKTLFSVIHLNCEHSDNRLENLKVVTRKEMIYYEKESCGKFKKLNRLQEYISPTGKVKLKR
jgi:hypothetical protein